MTAPHTSGAPTDADHVFLTRLTDGSGAGVRLAVKDCIDVAGTITTAGCPVVARNAPVATADAACLAGARAARARIVGKTNLHELCFGATGVNPHYGTPRNPLDPDRVPGGSSSGSAVAVATGQADIAFGTDTAGSVRNPAACCGVVGVKTTFGRIPVAGTRPLAPSMDTIGPLARDVAGAVWAMALLEPGFVAGRVDDPGAIRLGRFRGVAADPRLDTAVDAALATAGLATVDVALDGWDRAHESGLRIMYAEAVEVNRALVEGHLDELGADVRERFARAVAITPEELGATRRWQESWRDELARALGPLDAIVSVQLPAFPARLDALDGASNTAAVAVSFAGFPAVCLPVPTVDGPPTVGGTPFPASLQLLGPPGSEETLLGIARVVEAGVGSPLRP